MQNTIDQLKTLIKANINNADYKAIYVGDPVFIPSSTLPCIIINPESNSIETNDTAQDMHRQEFTITYAMDKRKELNKVPDYVVTVKKMLEIMEARDSSTGKLKTTSIAGMLRGNFTLSEIATDQFVEILYGVQNRGEREELITAEAQIRFIVEDIVLRN